MHLNAWTFDFPVCFSSSEYSKKNLVMLPSGDSTRLNLTPISSGAEVRAEDLLALGVWSDDGKFTIRETFSPAQEGDVKGALPFRTVWEAANRLSQNGSHSNSIEIFIVRKQYRSRITMNTPYELDQQSFRPGFYLFDQTQLIDVAVIHNNRAVLVPQATVGDLMRNAESDNRFTPMSTWFSAYAGIDPPDLYSTQHAQYDRLFSIYSMQA